MIFDTLSVIAALTIALRILLFRRQGRRFKRAVSILAWFLANAATATAVLIFVRGLPIGPPGVAITVFLCALAALTWKAQGNLVALSDILRRPEKWIHL